MSNITKCSYCKRALMYLLIYFALLQTFVVFVKYLGLYRLKIYYGTVKIGHSTNIQSRIHFLLSQALDCMKYNSLSL